MAFSDSVRQAATERKALLEMIARKVVLDVGKSLVMRSPVGDPSKWENHELWKTLGWVSEGYAGGRFRANWQHGYGAITAGEVDALDPSGSATLAKLEADINAAPAAGIHYLGNNLPYAQRLENGYSKQAPFGMVSLTKIQFEQVVANVARIR